MNNIIKLKQNLPEQYQVMLSNISLAMPEIERQLVHHVKGRTQFKANIIDVGGAVAGVTKLRNLRAILAKINESLAGLEEASFEAAELDIRIKQHAIDAQNQTGLAQEYSDLQAQKLIAKHARIMKAIEGAIRKIAGYTEQFNELEINCKRELGLGENDKLTEYHFEKDEERYHIMKAFEQALHAFRTIGRIDEGNNIFFFDIGISGELARRDIVEYLNKEDSVIKGGRYKPHEVFNFEFSFLEQMAVKYTGCSDNAASVKGMLPLSKASLLLE